MKRLVIVTLLVVSAAAAYAGGVLQSDGVEGQAGRTKIQAFAPNARKSQNLTVNRSGVINMTSSACWSVYAPADCSFKIHSTATFTGGDMATAPGGQWFTRCVNERSPYVSYSGCTSGRLHRD